MNSPGRFVAAHLVKVFFAYLVLHYDFDELKAKPGGLWVSDHYFPKTVTLTCRRREQDRDLEGKSGELNLATVKEKAA